MQTYQERGAYTDCFFILVGRQVELAEFVSAFYTTWLFRLERWVLKWLARRPSSDEDVRRLVQGESNDFAAWSVEGRASDQLLMCDMHQRTRSWFMVAPQSQQAESTVLFFGSAVVPLGKDEQGQPRMGTGFGVLKAFHICYSRALLGLARSRLSKL